jgi:hypothetical protein
MQGPEGKENYLLTVLSISFVLGMAVAICIYLAWRSGAIPPGFHDALSAFSLIVCPPFILSFVVGAVPDAGLALALVVGTIVLANGFLYSGVGAGGYFIMTRMVRKKRRP